MIVDLPGDAVYSIQWSYKHFGTFKARVNEKTKGRVAHKATTLEGVASTCTSHGVKRRQHMSSQEHKAGSLTRDWD